MPDLEKKKKKPAIIQREKISLHEAGYEIQTTFPRCSQHIRYMCLCMQGGKMDNANST